MAYNSHPSIGDKKLKKAKKQLNRLFREQEKLFDRILNAEWHRSTLQKEYNETPKGKAELLANNDIPGYAEAMLTSDARAQFVRTKKEYLSGKKSTGENVLLSGSMDDLTAQRIRQGKDAVVKTTVRTGAPERNGENLRIVENSVEIADRQGRVDMDFYENMVRFEFREGSENTRYNVLLDSIGDNDCVGSTEADATLLSDLEKHPEAMNELRRRNVILWEE